MDLLIFSRRDIPSSWPRESAFRAHCRCAADKAGVSVVLEEDRELKFLDVHFITFATYHYLHKLRMPCTPRLPHLDHVLHLAGRIWKIGQPHSIVLYDVKLTRNYSVSALQLKQQSQQPRSLRQSQQRSRIRSHCRSLPTPRLLLRRCYFLHLHLHLP